MADEQVSQAEPVLERAQKAEDALAQARVERVRGLVEDEQARLAGERPGDVDALAA
ncbi:hypothetical protein [Glycomyces tarimensis]